QRGAAARRFPSDRVVAADFPTPPSCKNRRLVAVEGDLLLFSALDQNRRYSDVTIARVQQAYWPARGHIRRAAAAQPLLQQSLAAAVNKTNRDLARPLDHDFHLMPRRGRHGRRNGGGLAECSRKR